MGGLMLALLWEFWRIFANLPGAQMTRAFTPNNDPACTHTHYYTATFQWAVP
jgi:hypothetical protein